MKGGKSQQNEWDEGCTIEELSEQKSESECWQLVERNLVVWLNTEKLNVTSDTINSLTFIPNHTFWSSFTASEPHLIPVFKCICCKN